MFWFGSVIILSLVTTTDCYLLPGDDIDTVSIGDIDANNHVACSGVSCPASEGAQCVNGHCVCPDGQKGLGALACYKSDRYETCSNANDPNTRNFQGEFAELLSPCQSKFAEYRFFSPKFHNYTTRCNVQIRQSSERFHGKFFVGGFDVRIAYKRPGKPLLVTTFRGVGSVDPDQDEYSFQRRVRTRVGDVRNDWKHADDPTVDTDGVPYEFRALLPKRKLKLRVPVCGLLMYFRPAHPDQAKDQMRMPGLSLGVNKRTGKTKWTDLSSSTCLAPEAQGGPSFKSMAQDQGLSKMEAAAMVAFDSKPQKNNFLNEECRNFQNAVQDCPESRKADAVKTCLSILNYEHFVRCYSVGNRRQVIILQLLQSCYKAVCHNNRQQCTDAQTAARDKCPDYVGGVDFNDFNCNSL